ncbi:hypothetical protein MPSEU_000683400 [Mayamaea pseudoterrestris]|nr:hypothetical protein MPSEU_000683400 [Mayamaea pseudoterrestris]
MNEPNFINTSGLVIDRETEGQMSLPKKPLDDVAAEASSRSLVSFAHITDVSKIRQFQQAVNFVSHIPETIVTALVAAQDSATSSLSSTNEPTNLFETNRFECTANDYLIIERPLKKARSVSESSTDGFLLAHPSDTKCLSPLHTFIRQQIEVFTATAVELSAPAPGRKVPILLHQVGLRCIHCKHSPKRVKRAVSYPTTVARVYHCVSDQRQHFSQCPCLPAHVQATIQALKNEETKQKPFSLLTAQHYKRTAWALGLRDTDAGAVFLAKDVPLAAITPSVSPSLPTLQQVPSQPPRSKLLLKRKREQSTLPHAVSLTSMIAATAAISAPVMPRAHNGCRLLSLDQDRFHLNDVHCWVRRHIEAFAATEQDVLVPSPGRKQRIFVGQVGLRCIHCAGSKLRVKRSICFAPTTSAVYHAVCNMRYDHFKLCPGLSVKDRAEYEGLLEAARTKTSAGKGSSNSTAKYYKCSAMELGLIDTDNGIRFQDVALPEEKPQQQDETLQACAHDKKSPTMSTLDESMKGISALMIAASNPELQAAFTQRKRSIQVSPCSG